MSESFEKHEQSISETERTAARMKSYTGSAVLVFFLYWLFFLPGFIVNYIYYRDAQKMSRIAGSSLPGQGCLGFMLWFHVAVIALGIFGMIFLVIASSF